jgi:antitoxin VapB
MADTTTVFQSGNSQAVRLPKEFRFKSKTVEIFRRGNEVVLREKPRTLGELLDSLPPVTLEMAEEIAQVFEAARDRSLPQERDWDALWGEPAAAPKATPTLKRRPPAVSAGAKTAAPAKKASRKTSK